MAETFGHLAAAHKKVLQEEKARREKAAKEVAEQRRREHAESLRIAGARLSFHHCDVCTVVRLSQFLCELISH